MSDNIVESTKVKTPSLFLQIVIVGCFVLAPIILPALVLWLLKFTFLAEAWIIVTSLGAIAMITGGLAGQAKEDRLDGNYFSKTIKVVDFIKSSCTIPIILFVIAAIGRGISDLYNRAWEIFLVLAGLGALLIFIYFKEWEVEDKRKNKRDMLPELITSR